MFVTVRASLLFLALTSVMPVAAAQVVPVTFRVNMTHQIAEGRFNPATEFVDVAGTFNNWGSTLTRLADPDGDGIHEVTVDGFTSYQTVEYKFRLNGQWGGREEFPGVGNNRRYTVQPDDNVIEVWYNDEQPAGGPPVAGFTASTGTTHEGGLVFFEDQSYGSVEAWQWTFEGGTPSTSTGRNPSVRYEEAGTYAVQLVVSGPEGADTLRQAAAVTVRARAAAETYWWNDAVFYEIFVRSFYDSDGDGHGDFNGLTEKLDYLNDGDPNTTDDLGITGIWLMPIHKTMTEHGYDVTDYRSINPEYGTMEDFQRFLAGAHARGIRVIIDYVMNHSSDRHPWFQAAARRDSTYRDFYRWSGTDPAQIGPWGQDVWHYRPSGYYYGLFWSGMPDLNYETPAVMDSITAAASFWLKDIGVDGFRLDAVKYLHEEGSVLENTEETYRLWSDFSGRIRQAREDVYTVCEAWDATAVAARYVTDGGMSTCFEFDLASAILNAVQSGDGRALTARIETAYAAWPYLQFGTFLTNHDQNRVMDVLGDDWEKARTAAALYLTLPGVPYIYYGEEIGLSGSKPDPLIRRPLPWSSAPNGGFTTGTPWLALADDYPTRNIAAQDADTTSLLHWYRRLVGLRNREAALRVGAYSGVVSSAPPVVAYLRQHEGETLLVAVNTGAQDQYDVSLALAPDAAPAGSYRFRELLGSGDTLSAAIDEQGRLTGYAIPAYATRVYRLERTGATSSGEERAREDQGLLLYPNEPNPASGSTSIRFSLPEHGAVTLELFNVLGQRVRTILDGVRSSGLHSVLLDTGGLPGGVYYYRLRQGAHQQTRRMVVLG